MQAAFANEASLQPLKSGTTWFRGHGGFATCIVCLCLYAAVFSWVCLQQQKWAQQGSHLTRQAVGGFPIERESKD